MSCCHRSMGATATTKAALKAILFGGGFVQSPQPRRITFRKYTACIYCVSAPGGENPTLSFRAAVIRLTRIRRRSLTSRRRLGSNASLSLTQLMSSCVTPRLKSTMAPVNAESQCRRRVFQCVLFNILSDRCCILGFLCGQTHARLFARNRTSLQDYIAYIGVHSAVGRFNVSL